MSNTAVAVVDLQVEQLHKHLSSMYQSMHFVVGEIHRVEAPDYVRERVLTLGECFLFTIANAVDELQRMGGNAHEITRRAFINVRRVLFAMHAIVVDTRERHPDSMASILLHALGMDILNAFHEAGPLLAKLGGWYYEGFRTESPWKPMASDPRLAECIVNE